MSNALICLVSVLGGGLIVASVRISLIRMLALKLKRLEGRVRSKVGTEVVADLDALLVKSVWFTFGGRAHKIPPLSNADFLKAMNALAELDLLRHQKRVKSIDELEAAYLGVFSVVCPTITKEDVKEMSQQQVAALMLLVQETIMGKAQVDAEKKSPLKTIHRKINRDSLVSA